MKLLFFIRIATINQMKTLDFLNKETILKITFVGWLIGGGYQFLSLWAINIFYIKFFSVTQMIADTIMLLVPITIIVLFLIFGFKEAYFFFSKRGIIITFTLLVTNSLGTIFFLPLIIPIDTPPVMTLLVSIILFLVSLFLVKFTIKKLQQDKTDRAAKIISGFIAISGMSCILFFFYLLSTDYLRNIFITPDHFLNKEYICKQVVSDSSCKILYFNDKYIFIEKTKDQIEIVKFDSFFKQRHSQFNRKPSGNFSF